MEKIPPAVDPVYYSSVPWEFHLVRIGMDEVRSYFENPVISSLYARDIHLKPAYGMDTELYLFSIFAKLKTSSWTLFRLSASFADKELEHLQRSRKRRPADTSALSSKDAAKVMANELRRESEMSWRIKQRRVALLSRIFSSQALLFGYEDTGDTLYYELFENGFWRESFMGGLYDPSVSDRNTFCQLKSDLRPGLRPCNDEKRFVEESFRSWNIALPFVVFQRYEKNPVMVEGKPPECSAFSPNDIEGLDCAMIHAVLGT